MASSYRLSLENWLKDLDVDANAVLDFGGSQLPVDGRVKSWNVKTYIISDLKKPHKMSREVDFVFNLEVDHYKKEWRKFDVVFCLEVFEYVIRPDVALDNIARSLKSGGVAYVSFPFVYPIHEPVEYDSLRYTETGIRRLAEEVGLAINKIHVRRPETSAILQVYSAERLRAAKGHDHHVLGYIVEFSK